jgi:hypothetical protein
MSEDKNSTDSVGKQPKKGLSISHFLKPVANVQTSIGKLYLFPLRVSDIRSYERISIDDPVGRIRDFLPCIASLSPDYSLKQERGAITIEQVGQLSYEEVEALAEAYISSSTLGIAREGGKKGEALARSQGEPATLFLDRLIRKEIEEHASQMSKIQEQVLGSTNSIFDQVRKSSLELGKTWKSFERLSKATEISPLEKGAVEIHNHLAEHQARLTRERAEDRGMIRLTGQMTAQSAKTLQELAEAASTLLEKLDERDVEAKRTTKIQLWIAVFTVVISAVFSGASFWQDRVNNATGDHWQADLLSEVRESNQRRSALEDEAKSLKEDVLKLQHQVLELDGQLRRVKDTKTVSAASHPKPKLHPNPLRHN